MEGGARAAPLGRRADRRARARSTGSTSRSGSTTPTTTGRTTRAARGRTRFFSYLSSIACAKPLTEWQQAYNAQAGVLDVTSNRWIDAPTVEKRLIDTAPPGVDTRKPTIFFINWYGRSDFKFHVYSKTGEPDPDTGHDFGALSDDRKIVAWGGTTPDDEETGLGRRGVHRVWFYDLSAGPEAWGGNFDITNADLDGDGVADYRIPVSWEYGSYRPKVGAGGRPRQGDPLRRARPAVHELAAVPAVLHGRQAAGPRRPRRQHGRGPARRRRLARVHQARPVPPRGARAAGRLRAQPGLPGPVVLAATSSAASRASSRSTEAEQFSCFPKYELPPDANLFLAAAFNQRPLPRRRRRLRGGAHQLLVTPDAPTPLGYADDNWLDGTQSGVFSFVSPGIVEAGYGLTTTMIHEYGHHSSMSHPHDGYDPDVGRRLRADRRLLLRLARRRVELDDELHRRELGLQPVRPRQLGSSPRRRLRADRQPRSRRTSCATATAARRSGTSRPPTARCGERRTRSRTHDYNGMLAHAASAYRSVRAGAAKAGVKVRVRQPSTWTVVGAPRSRMSGQRDRPRRPQNRKRFAR